MTTSIQSIGILHESLPVWEAGDKIDHIVKIVTDQSTI